MHFIIEFLKHALETWGYWAVLVALLCENAGVPLPGETILLFASFLAYKGERLQIQWIIVIGIVACTIGDNIGYWIGHRGGRPLLDHWKRFFRITHEDIVKGEQFLNRYGWFAIFIARFIAGMRIVAGPMAGILCMPWKKFVTANFCGAAVWVTTISLVGYAFGSKSDELLGFLERLNNFVLIAIVGAIVAWWFWRRRKSRAARRAVSDTMK
jgi:membrane protein DedA with SNARE-associated domain